MRFATPSTNNDFSKTLSELSFNNKYHVNKECNKLNKFCCLPHKVVSYLCKSGSEVFLGRYKANLYERQSVCPLPINIPTSSLYKAEQIGNYYICAYKNDGFYLFDSKGNVILSSFALIEHVSGDFFVCYTNAEIEDKYDDEDKTHYYYLVTQTTPIIYFKDKQLASGQYFFDDSHYCNMGYLFVNTNNIWYVFDENGQLRFVQDKNGWQIKRNDGHNIINEYFKSIICEEQLIVAQKTSGWGVWNCVGENILPPMNESIIVFSDVLMYQIGEATGVSLYNGKQILLPKYNFIGKCIQWAVGKGDCTDDIDYNNFIIPGFDSLIKTPAEYKNSYYEDSEYHKNIRISSIQTAEESYYIFTDNREYLLFSVKRGIISKIPYSIKSQISEDFFLVEQENKLGVFSTKDQELVIPCDYDRIRYDGTIFICSYTFQETDNEQEDCEKILQDIFYKGNKCLLSLEEVFCIGKQFYSAHREDVNFVFCVDDTNNLISTYTDICSEYDYYYRILFEHISSKNQIITRSLEIIKNKNIYISDIPYFLKDNYLLVKVSYEGLEHRGEPQSTNEITNIISKDINSSIRIDTDFCINVNKNNFNDEFHYGSSFCIIHQKQAIFKFNDDTKEFTPCVLPKYDEICLNEDGNFDVRIGNSWGIVSPDGVELTRIKYKEKVRDVVVRDAETNKIGILSDDYSIETIPTIYDTIIYDDDNEIGVYDIYDAPLFDLELLTHKPIAVGKATKIEHEYDERRNEQSIYIDDYEIFDKWSLANIKYAIINSNKNHCVELIYDKIRIKGSYLIAFGPEIEEFKVNTNIDRYKHLKKRSFVDIYSQSQEKIYSVKDANVTIDLFHHAEIIEFKDDTPFIKKFHSLKEGWDIQFVIDQNIYIRFISEHLFCKNIHNKDSVKIKYSILDRFGHETPVQYMLYTYPIEGWFFAARNQGDDYVVVLIHQDALDKEIIVYKDITLADLLNIVESNGLYLGSKIDIETNEYFDKAEFEFKQWIKEQKEDFCPNSNCSDKDDSDKNFCYYDTYWISGELTDLQQEKEESENNDYSSDYYDASDYDRDTWYALTDGQCGEYPGSSSADDVYDGLGW